MGVALRLVCLASGRGTNFMAIADAITRGDIPGAEIVALISNNPLAPALELAKARHIPTQIVDSSAYGRGKQLDRNRYEKALMEVLEKLSPDYICLAGYMLLLGPEVIERWTDRIVNIHPSLLPAFKGLRAQRQALAYGVKWTGCTVHFVDQSLDGGRIIEQQVLEVLDQDNEESLSQRLLAVEHRTYIAALKKICARNYELKDRRVVRKSTV